MAGGSAGAICWWSGGHSDSIDPHSYKREKLRSRDEDIDDDNNDGGENEESKEREEKEQHDEAEEEWDYIRVDGLGFIPGLCCPHHDRVQSNGILRATDFNHMLLRHPTEVGICIDHNAAFLIEGDNYRVIYPTGDEFIGSVMPDGTFSGDRLGRPGVWIKELMSDECTVSCFLCPASGKLEQLLKDPKHIRHSYAHELIAEKENPDDGPLRMSYPGFRAKSYFGGRLSEQFRSLHIQEEEGDEE